MASGSHSYVVEYRHNGKSPRMSLSAVMDLTTARKKAKAILGEAAQGRDPIGEDRRAREAAKNTLRFGCDEYFVRNGVKLTSSKRQKQDRDQAIRRCSAVGPDRRQARVTRGPQRARPAHILKLFPWHASRDDDFRSPSSAAWGGARPAKPRDRTLPNDELRVLWHAAEAGPGAVWSVHAVPPADTRRRPIWRAPAPNRTARAARRHEVGLVATRQ
jgi:Arm DNA-binding domain